MISQIILILSIFIILLASVWRWFFKNAKTQEGDSYKLSQKAFKNGDYKKVKELLLNSSAKGTKFMLGVSQLELGELDDAKASFEQVIKEAPKNVEALLNLAQVHQKQKNYDEALDTYNKILNGNSDNLECILNVGLISYEKGKYNDAIEYLEKAKELSPNNTQVLFSIAKCKGALCDLNNDEGCQQALDEYSKIANNPDLPKEFDSDLAKLYAKSGNIDKALECCQKVLVKESENIEIYKLLGLVQFIKKDYNGAKATLSTAINLKPDDIEAHNILSYVLCQNADACQRDKCREKYYEVIKKYLKEDNINNVFFSEKNDV